MAISEDRIKLLIDILGTADVKQLNEALEQTGVQLKRVEAAGDAASGAAGGGKRGMAGFGQSMMQVGRGVQDFQAAGLMGIVNNIEGMALAMGGGAGLAGALTLAAVGFQVFGPKLKEFIGDLLHGADAPKRFADSVSMLKDRIEELKKTPLELNTAALQAAETQLNRIQKAQQAVAALLGVKTPEEVAAGKATAEAITAGGGQEALIRGVTESRRQEIIFGQRQEMARQQAEVEAVQRELDKGARPTPELLGRGMKAQQAIKDIQDKAAQTAAEQAADIFREATGQGERPGMVGPAQAQLARHLRRAGRGDLAGQIAGLDPGALAARQVEMEAAGKETEDLLGLAREHQGAMRRQPAEARREAEKARREAAERSKRVSEHVRSIEIEPPKKIERLGKVSEEMVQMMGPQAATIAAINQNEQILAAEVARLRAIVQGNARGARANNQNLRNMRRGVEALP